MSTPDLLIIDGERDRFSLRSILEREGINVIEAMDAASGLAIVRDQDPRAVLVGLPGTRGRAVIEHLVSEHRDTAALIAANRAHMTDVALALQHGAWDFVLKPFSDVATLLSTVSRGLQRASLQRQSRVASERIRLITRCLSATLSPESLTLRADGLSESEERGAFREPPRRELPPSAPKLENPEICRHCS